MKSHAITKTLTGLIASAMLAAVSQAEVTISDFSSFNLTGTYGSWGSGTFTSGATAFRIQAASDGGGFKDLVPAINASGNDTISIKLDVNPGNVATKFNLVLFDADGTARVYRFDGISVGNNQTFTKNVASFLQDNNVGSVPGLNLANLTAFHIQGTFENANAIDMTFDNLSMIVAPFVPDQIINGNFETPNGAGWGTVQGTPSFPTTGGNPDGNAVLDGTGGFAVLYAFNNTEKTFASLGLAPGDTYTFQMDMKLVSGTNIGGVRLEGPAGYVVEQYPAIIGDGSTWETYSIQLTVPNSPAQSKFGLRPGVSSIVAFDNVKIVLPGPPPPVVATIEQGTVVGWTVNNPANTYQPQKRNAVEDPWTDIGGPVPGTSVPYVFEETASNFYQVLETVPGTPENAVLNPGFETLNEAMTFADKWTVLSAVNGGAATIAASYPGGYLPHTGDKMLVLESTTPLTGLDPAPPAPNVAVSCDFFAVTGNTSYDLSFWAAHVLKTGGANPQYILEFFGDDGFGQSVFLGNQIYSFASVGDTWTKVERTFTTPAGALTMRIQLIQALGAAYAWQWITLLDDFELLTPGAGSVNENEATAGPGVEISWNTNSGKTYQVKSSGNLVDWSNFGSSVVGDGNIFSVADPITPPGVKFYRVGETP
jgi:hypothetical protein